MQTDQDLFNFIKENYPLNPGEEFVSLTEVKLRRNARKNNVNRKIKRYTITSSVLLFTVSAISWFFFFNGQEVINQSISSSNPNHLSSTTTGQNPVIYIYHTHNTEAFLPEIKETKPLYATHEKKNITLVGKHFSYALKERNISSIHDKSDITAIAKERNVSYRESYDVSRQIFKDALNANKSIKMAFDIHRDSGKRNNTTVHINGKDYAEVFFTVSRSTHNYEENKKFAEFLHNKLEEKYPGLSKGIDIIAKDQNHQGIYNQDLIKQSLLLNIGGQHNTLKESYRTVEALAEVIEENMEFFIK
ncbi:stage II sporulation protein P [Bacillus sp. JJ722]|uniref:stage II sporulation protein P n=1 Tax=Bacillus sp. JJ722 TaxID=3122973 RepID=UPI0030006373